MNRPVLAAYCTHEGMMAVLDSTLDKLDILNYAFGSNDETDIVFHWQEDLQRVYDIKNKHPHIKVILSVGGGGCAKKMTNAVSTPERFRRVIDNMVEAMLRYGFDGIDLDWEFPTMNDHPEERLMHTEMLRILREKLDAQERRYYLSVAVPDGEWTFKITDLDHSHIYLDYINVMTYDMTSFTYTSHHTAPYSSKCGDSSCGRSVCHSIQVFENHGIPAEKLLIGGAFYSKKWSGITGGYHGLGVPVTVQAEYGPGMTALKNNYINKNGYTRYWDEDAHAPFLYNGDTLITYDDKESITCKCDMVVRKQIGGIMVWELSGDREQTMLPYMRSCLDSPCLKKKA